MEVLIYNLFLFHSNIIHTWGGDAWTGQGMADIRTLPLENKLEVEAAFPAYD